MISPGLEKSNGISSILYPRNWTDSKKHIFMVPTWCYV